MRILIIGQYFRPDITAAANRLSDVADQLAARGHEVTVVTATPHKSDITNTSEYDNASAADIHRVHVKTLVDEKAQGYMAQYLSFSLAAFKMAFRQCRKARIEVIWVSSPPLPVTVASIMLRMLTWKPVVLDVRDIWPESAVNIGKLRRGSVTEKMGKILERISYAHACQITCVSENMKSYIGTISKRPVSVVYNGVPQSEITAFTTDNCDPDIFCYAGNIGHAQDLGVVIEGFAKAKSAAAMSNAHLLVIGDGAIRREMEGFVSELGIEDSVAFTGALPKPDAIARMRQAGCLLVPLKDSPAFNVTVPSKIFDCLALGRPIISNVVGEGKAILEESGANLVVAPGSVEDFAQAFLEIRENWPNYVKYAEKNVLLVTTEFSREKSIDILEVALKRAAR